VIMTFCDVQHVAHVDDIHDEALSATIEVHEIPNDCDEVKLRAILENKRYTEVIGAEVINVQFAEGNHSRAIVTLSSPEGTEMR